MNDIQMLTYVMNALHPRMVFSAEVFGKGEIQLIIKVYPEDRCRSYKTPSGGRHWTLSGQPSVYSKRGMELSKVWKSLMKTNWKKKL